MVCRHGPFVSRSGVAPPGVQRRAGRAAVTSPMSGRAEKNSRHRAVFRRGWLDQASWCYFFFTTMSQHRKGQPRQVFLHSLQELGGSSPGVQ